MPPGPTHNSRIAVLRGKRSIHEFEFHVATEKGAEPIKHVVYALTFADACKQKKLDPRETASRIVFWKFDGRVQETQMLLGLDKEQ